MMTHDIAFELSRQRIELFRERASPIAMLGELPPAQPLFPFRRQKAMPLSGPVEVRHFGRSDKDRIHRRLLEISASQRDAS